MERILEAIYLKFQALRDSYPILNESALTIKTADLLWLAVRAGRDFTVSSEALIDAAYEAYDSLTEFAGRHHLSGHEGIAGLLDDLATELSNAIKAYDDAN